MRRDILTIRQRKFADIFHQVEHDAGALQVEQDVPESLWKDCDASTQLATNGQHDHNES